ncbi:iron(3+)-hydroxamate ABC transporter permease protein FhuB (plasmid) [Rhizobium phaseoli]|uniref:Fe(3+)-hydroxamate ABC transporter permease FhuB n=1 Tax=Rhizobium phaseoli TaxID=396 RepID=UPI0007EA4E68|nr:Fe(3+)-hydroxamate ABC transporter permease FhuB [Rhizobium phaseoli]ANL38141.1 iron(3+)-hydroxamate ABC transporter permease protein FhuB [Rhizobium phaseoli]ANL43981.1 iron(3+)-hydroxamate ABC transporter permease protein FhuB [Rhizobium phaseoli]ANL62944.1 iron(3+)-hydroxamate ABC transporter permease protein FhuB [Rhizobium phaseoli]ANL69672.1 iron(3+)-hydroxamate ABC transporter permease protein FhuB [Rhizobium phaseoli]ANL76114.1 iron(3+)-hydroxamate ABC transporter permease protein F
MTAQISRFGAPALAALLLFSGLGLALLDVLPALPHLETSGGYDAQHLLLLYSTLPRMATALITGAALALSGTILQQVLRNPLASPTTLGVSAGANLALVSVMLAFPSLTGWGRDAVALAGSAAAAFAIFSISARHGFSPFSLILSGMIIGLWCGAAAAILILTNEQYLSGIFIWGAGSLSQQSWAIPISLLPKVALLAALALLATRPLALTQLGDAGATSLGLPIKWARGFILAIAIALSALVTSAVGVIGFIGLVAPQIVRLAGARRVVSQLIWSPVAGAGLLLLTDEAIELLAPGDFVPTGAVTALLGGPILIALLPRLATATRALPGMASPKIAVGSRTTSLVLLLLAVAALATAAVFFGRAPDGSWAWLPAAAWDEILPLRLPRVAAAFGAGTVLGVTGLVLQRLTGNEMASPEVLGVSAGATLGVAAAMFAFAAPGLTIQLAFAGGGALAVLLLILLLSARSGFGPNRVLLAGIAFGAILDAGIGVLAASGDPRGLALIRWMAGSTYFVDNYVAASAMLIALAGIIAAFLASRWLALLQLGSETASELGLRIAPARGVLFGLSAIMTAAATLVVGPLSFVGLMAPHLAHGLGLRRPSIQLLAAALIGATLLVIADWAGRMIAFPYQVPAGLISALVGAPMLLYVLRRRP